MSSSKAHQGLFFRLGENVYHYRWWVIAAWIAIFICCIPCMPHLMSPFKSTGFVANHSESEKTNHILNIKFGNHYNRLIILYQNPHHVATSPFFTQQIKQSLSDLSDFPLAHRIILPNSSNHQISRDQHSAYVVIQFKDPVPMSHALFTQLQQTIHTPHDLRMLFGGEAVFVENINDQTERDLYHADGIAVPISIIALLLVFGTLVAAFIPICLGGGCALLILTLLYIVGHFFNLSIFTLNIALLLGLCLSLDYALFIIYRFREELHRDPKNMKAITATTLSTAGKAIFFSGLAVFISLSALLFFPINILFSVGVGGLTAVFIAVILALTLLPALLAVVKQGIDRWAIRSVKTKEICIDDPHQKNLWYRLAQRVINRPILYFLISLAVLLSLSYPILHMHIGMADVHALPKNTDSRQFYHAYSKAFSDVELSPIMMLISSPQSPILSKKNLGIMYDLIKTLQKNKSIKRIDGLMPQKGWTKEQYINFYHHAPLMKNQAIEQTLNMTTRKHIALFSIVSRYNENSKRTIAIIHQLRQIHLKNVLKIHLTGVPVNQLDVFNAIKSHLTLAVIWIITLTYFILFALLRSLFLPFKAIMMNILSLCASYGVLVYIFQDGHFHHALHFYPQGMIDISLLIIIFCALFGFSMDYEVFLLTRIQEFYLKTKNNDQSIVFGIVKSSNIITSAAAIVICLCGAFMVADVLIVKEFGLGIAAAIIVDAFIIRAILVPATMALLKTWNWYLPQWMQNDKTKHID